jgi:4-hydroxybenzoate polyprenyltransferase
MPGIGIKNISTSAEQPVGFPASAEPIRFDAAESEVVRTPVVSKARSSRSVPLVAAARLVRARQWTKNVFVLLPLLFSGEGLWSTKLVNALLAVGSFCLISSAVYVFNDLVDVARDRKHPRKCHRLIAAGVIGSGTAVMVVMGLLLAGCAVMLLLPAGVMAIGGLYLVNSVGYCLWLKRVVLLDVLMIANGFVLRLLAGCSAIGVEASAWIVACGFSLALALGFGKRRAELAVVGPGNECRQVLRDYSRSKLDTLMGISVAICLLCYMLYTLAPETIALHRTRYLVYTVPPVAYGLFRYLLKVQDGTGDDPTEILVCDPVFGLTGFVWASVVFVVLYIG